MIEFIFILMKYYPQGEPVYAFLSPELSKHGLCQNK